MLEPESNEWPPGKLISRESSPRTRARRGANVKLFPRNPARSHYSPNYRLVGDPDLIAMIAGMILEIQRDQSIGRVILQK